MDGWREDVVEENAQLVTWISWLTCGAASPTPSSSDVNNPSSSSSVLHLLLLLSKNVSRILRFCVLLLLAFVCATLPRFSQLYAVHFVTPLLLLLLLFAPTSPHRFIVLQFVINTACSVYLLFGQLQLDKINYSQANSVPTCCCLRRQRCWRQRQLLSTLCSCQFLMSNTNGRQFFLINDKATFALPHCAAGLGWESVVKEPFPQTFLTILK